MKISFFTILLLISTSVGRAQTEANAGGSSSSTYRVGERGPHHRVIERTTSRTNRLGQMITVTNQAYVELATGMHYQDAAGRWLESKEEIEILPQGGGAAARHGQHKARFAGNLNSAGAIQLETPDGKILRSHVLGLSYFDTASGRSVLIAELKDSLGVLYPPNVIVYPDAFTDFKADVRYTYTRAGFEQDIILHERPPGPEEWGLNPTTTRLQVLTEFLNPPSPHKQQRYVKARDGSAGTDESLDFGVMKIGQGQAFSLERGTGGQEIPVSKQWLKLDGRDFLVEEVAVSDLQEELPSLPAAGHADAKRPDHAVRRVVSRDRVMPQAPPPARAGMNDMKLAKLPLPAQGLVLDYQTLNSSLTNFTFRGDTTYYISGNVNLYGTNTFEGGAVLKYTNGTSVTFPNTTPGLQLNWLAGAYRPVILTARDDNSVGDTISGSSGNPVGYYASTALTFFGVSTQSFAYVRVAYASQAILVGGTRLNVSHAQIVNCQNGFNIAGATINLFDALFSRTGTNFIFNGGGICNVQNLTVDKSICLGKSTDTQSGCSLTATNCILANCTNLSFGVFTLSGDFNGFYNCVPFGTVQLTNTFNPFMTVGAGNYYLTNGCNFFNQGTTNINQLLLADLGTRTTYPPIAYTNLNLTTPTTWTPQAQRDIDTPDLGFHYAPIDYAVSGVAINTTLTLSNGVAVAAFQDYVALPGAGFLMTASGDRLVTVGTAQVRNHLSSYQAVQEQPIKWGSNPLGANILLDCLGVSIGGNPVPPEVLDARFTDFDGISGMGSDNTWGAVRAVGLTTIYGDTMQLIMKDCRVGPGWIGCLVFEGTATNQCSNTLFDRGGIFFNDFDGDSPVSCYNNLFHNGYFSMGNGGLSYTWELRDTLFDNAVLNSMVPISSYGNVTFDHNAFLNTTELTPTGTADVLLGTFTYTNGPLGSFYQASTDLIDHGSRTAIQAGLSNYTVLSSQVKDSGTVDIGFHYAVPDPVTLETIDAFASEAGSWGEFSVKLPQPAGASGVNVSFNLSGAPNDGTVYSLLSPTYVTVPAGSSSAEVFIKPVNDSVYTGNKSVGLNLTAASGYPAYQIDGHTGTVTVVDDDFPTGIYPSTSHPTVTITATDADAREDTNQPPAVRTGTFQVTRTDDASDPNDLKRPLIVKIHLGGTATYGVDYDALADSGSMIIPANQTSGTIVITPKGDAIVEPLETVVAMLLPSVDYNITNPTTATIFIDDTNSAGANITYTVTAPDLIAIEPNNSGALADPGNFTVTRSGSVLNPATIYYATDPAAPPGNTLTYFYKGSATLGSDYDVVPPRSGGIPTPIVFPAGVSTTNIIITPLSDSATEVLENVQLCVTNSANTTQPFSTNTVFIYDSHAAAPSKLSVALSGPTLLNENSSPDSVNIVFTRTGNTKGVITVTFRLDGQASPDADYKVTGTGLSSLSPRIKQVLFGTDNASVSVTLSTIVDGIPEPVESVIVTIIDPPGSVFNQIGSPRQVAIRIRNTSTSQDYIPDTDHDGVNDLDELASSPPTDPLVADSDGDGLPDGFIANQAIDTDKDGINNAVEAALGLLKSDTDRDDLSDFSEILRGTDPTVVTPTTDTSPPAITVTSPTSPKITLLP